MIIISLDLNDLGTKIGKFLYLGLFFLDNYFLLLSFCISVVGISIPLYLSGSLVSILPSSSALILIYLKVYNRLIGYNNYSIGPSMIF